MTTEPARYGGVSLPPNIRWLAKHSGETVRLSFEDVTYEVQIRGVDNDVAQREDDDNE